MLHSMISIPQPETRSVFLCIDLCARVFIIIIIIIIPLSHYSMYTTPLYYTLFYVDPLGSLSVHTLEVSFSYGCSPELV